MKNIKRGEFEGMAVDEQLTQAKKVAEIVKLIVDKSPDMAVQINQNFISEEEAKKYFVSGSQSNNDDESIEQELNADEPTNDNSGQVTSEPQVSE